MTWTDRVNSAIYLTSPSGQEFTAAWQGSTMSFEKSVGRFKYPRADGEVVQDIGSGAVEEPLVLLFHWQNHDLDARRFFRACAERGVWSILHPVYGRITRQMLKVSMEVQPVTAGGYTQVTCDCIEPGLDNLTTPVAQLEEDVLEQVEVLQDAAVKQAEKNLVNLTPTLLGRIVAGVATLVGFMAAVTAKIAGITATVARVSAAVLSVVLAPVVSLVAMATAVQNLIRLPGQLLRDARARFAYFDKILSESLGLAPDAPTPSSRGAAVLHELVLTSGLAGVAEAVVDAQLSTREQAIEYLTRVEDMWSTVTARLDAAQAVYDDSPVDKQYFAQSQTYPEAAELLRRVRELLLRRSFDLAVAKTITLQRDRAPIEIALAEGVDFEVFCDSNALRADEILLLPAGRKVVVYL